MKCLECNKKLNVKNIKRICKMSDEHIYCDDCLYQHLLNNKSSDEIYCKQCNSLIYKKNEYTEEEILMFKSFGLLSFLAISTKIN